MTKQPRHALTRQMHFFVEFQQVLAELCARSDRPVGDLSSDIEDLAWRKALRRRRARLAAMPYWAGAAACA
jgi:hypothetical protein